jgi:hypothetical protein
VQSNGKGNYPNSFADCLAGLIYGRRRLDPTGMGVVMRPTIRIEISELLDQQGNCVSVRIRRTGKVANLPVRQVQFLPGAVSVPEWLAKKLQGEEGRWSS